MIPPNRVRRMNRTNQHPLPDLLSSPTLLYLCALSILLIPALQPLLTADLTCGYDNGFHLWRSVQIEHLLRQNVLISRWAPDMAHGYGYPLFNFAAPASAYAVALLRLAGLAWPWAVNLTFALGWLLSAYTAYLFVSDLLGRPAGLVSAVLYAYAPFHAYDVFYRGGLSQSSAWFLPPLILWALRRADSRLGFAVTGLGLAGLVLTHNAFALLFAPLFLAYCLCRPAISAADKRTALAGGLALLTGIGLSAGFWLPALADLRFVHSERLSGAWVFQYAHNFLPLEQLFAPPRTADPSLINDWPARGLGLIPALLAALGLLAGILNPRHRARRHLVAFFTGGLALCLFLILPISRPVWDSLPLLQRVQFPWRLSGPAALCAAVLSGFLVPPSRRTTIHLAGVTLLLALLIIGHLGWFYPRHCAPPSETSIAAMITWERETDTLGTTAKGEYLPIWVEQMPTDAALEDAYTAGPPITRLPPESLPEGGRILRTDDGPLDTTILLETPVPFQARYLALYYPGWRVIVDGDPVPITPANPDGTITFPVPAGRHTVRVRFGEMGLRLVADALSLVSLLSLISLLAIPAIWRPRPVPHPDPAPRIAPPLAMFIAALLLVTLKLTVFDRLDTPLRRANLQPAENQLHDVDVPAAVAFGPAREFALLGYDGLPDTIPSGGSLPVTTYWRALVPSSADYGVTLHVVDDRGYRWHDPNIQPPRWHRTPPPTWAWPPDQYAAIALDIPLLPGTPPGTYTVRAVAFDRRTLAPLTAYDAEGRALGPEFELGQVLVTPPAQPPDLDDLAISHHLDVPLGPLTLLGADADRRQGAPGDPVLLTTLWRADGQPTADLTAHLALLSDSGSIAAEFDVLPTSAYPTSQWRPGDIWRGQHLLRLPAGLETGVYTWRLSLPPTSPTVPLLAPLHVTAPDRSFTPPATPLAIETPLGDIATLVGADVGPQSREITAGSPLTITLVWRAEGETSTSYRVFLHLIGPDAAPIAQSDGIPARWTRPTTGWLPGEYVTDIHVLTVPTNTSPGPYTLTAGLYEPGGERLITPSGSDAIPLLTITVKAP